MNFLMENLKVFLLSPETSRTFLFDRSLSPYWLIIRFFLQLVTFKEKDDFVYIQLVRVWYIGHDRILLTESFNVEKLETNLSNVRD